MDVLFVFASCLFFLWVLRELFFWVFVWQANEYRQDRFFYFLRNRLKKAKLLNILFIILKSSILFSYVYVIFNDNFLTLYQYVIIGLFVLQAYLVLRDTYRNQIKKPLLDFRANSIIVLTIATIFLLFAIPLTDRFFWLLLLMQQFSLWSFFLFYFSYFQLRFITIGKLRKQEEEFVVTKIYLSLQLRAVWE